MCSAGTSRPWWSMSPATATAAVAAEAAVPASWMHPARRTRHTTTTMPSRQAHMPPRTSLPSPWHQVRARWIGTSLDAPSFLPHPTYPPRLRREQTRLRVDTPPGGPTLLLFRGELRFSELRHPLLSRTAGTL